MTEFRTLDSANRLTISNKFRKQLGADQDTLFKVELVKGVIVVTPVEVVAKKPLKE
jgi:DNA-binding transcriptional regulator/RsmH inhibitor MraZ